MADQSDAVDFALAAYREDGAWQVQELAHDVLEDVEHPRPTRCAGSPATAGAIGMVAVDEDFFVIVRVDRPDHPGAALRRHRRRRVGAGQLGHGLPRPARRRRTRTTRCPAGDLDLLGDLGMHAMDMGVLLDDVDLYPDEMLSDVARRLGFGELFDDAVGLTSA